MVPAMQIIAIIPARGGSKGIPRKNVKPLAGKPLVAWTIDAAKGDPRIGTVFVSTDDPEIGAVAQAYGASVIWRPAELSGDTASSESALLHGLDVIEQERGAAPDILVFLQCTSPLMTTADISGTLDALLNQRADSAFTATPFHGFVWRTDREGNALGVNHDKQVRPRRQEREREFLETGAVYAFYVQGFRQYRHRFFGKTAIYEMPASRSVEIDEPQDWRLVESLVRHPCPPTPATATLAASIRAVVFDFDGVFTDNRVWTFTDGREAVACSRGDGLGLAQLKMTNRPLLVLSTEQNAVVQARCHKLGIPCRHGIDDKLAELRRWAAEQQLPLEAIAYVGNDVNDQACLQAVGWPVVVADAHSSVKKQARIVLKNNGGTGAVREFCDLLTGEMNHA